MLRAVVPSLAVCLAAPLGGPARAHDPPQEGGAPDLGPEELYHVELYAHALQSLAMVNQAELLAEAASIYQGGPIDPAVFEALAQLVPAVHLRWEEGQLSLVSAPAITLTAGLSSPLLLEVENVDPTPHEVFAVLFDGAQPAPRSSFASIPPLTTRSLFAEAIAAGTGTTSLTIRLTVGQPTLLDDPVTAYLPLPVEVVPPVTIEGTAIDGGTGAPHAARITTLGSDGVFRHEQTLGGEDALALKVIPGMEFEDYRVPHSYTHLDGSFTVQAPPGAVELTVERGFEFTPVTQSFELAAGEVERGVSVISERFTHMAEQGWISGDTHVHWVIKKWFEDEDYGLLEIVQRAEDVQVVNNLTLRHFSPVNGEFTAPSKYPPGPVTEHSDAVYLLHQGEEFRNEGFYGHLNFLGITQLVEPISTGSLMGKGVADYPTNLAAAKEASAQGGFVTAAHGLGHSVTAEVALGQIDSLDQMQAEHYYRILDCGWRLPLTTGSDHPAHPVGAPRCYVRVQGDLTHAAWLEGIESRETFVTSGPLLALSVDGAPIGSEVVANSWETVHVVARAESRHPLGTFQVYSNHHVLAEVVTGDLEATLEFDIPADRTRWIVARCSPTGDFQPITQVDAAHTSAIYLTVDGARLHSKPAAQLIVDQLLASKDLTEQEGVFDTQAQREEALAVFTQGAQVWDDLQYYPHFEGAPRVGLAPLEVQFEDLSTNAPSRWQWDFENDGVTDSADPGPAHVYLQPGSYAVQLETPDALGDTTDLKQQYILVRSLVADTDELSLGPGGAASLDLGAGPAHAGQPYLLLGSITGTGPGIPVGGALVLPLVWDAYLSMTLNGPNQPPLAGSLGVLDSLGRATATFTLPPATSTILAGKDVHHAFAAFGPAGVAFVSEPASIALVP